MAVLQQLSYDQLPYPGLSHARTHPDRMATLARLLGMQPAPIDGCRILELGCGVGGNLIPMAYGLPGSQFIGIDLSGKQIEVGCQNINAMGLTNISLKQMDILDIGPEFGRFDYIIAHGVYSWVPPAVQDKILAVCKANLAPQGVAFVSYNTYPGWHMIELARGIMRYYAGPVVDFKQRADTARSILGWFAQAGESESSGYFNYLKFYYDYLTGQLNENYPKDDSALLHDELEECNYPLYFSEFVNRAAAHEMQYLGEIESSPASKKMMENLEYLQESYPTLVDREQSYDFLTNRTFRCTLLCHQNVELNRTVKPARLADFYIVSSAVPVSTAPDIAGNTVEQFKTHKGLTFSTDHPLSKTAMLCLSETYPRPVKFEALFKQAYARLEQVAAQQANATTRGSAPAFNVGDELRALAANLLKAYDYSFDLVELHSCPYPIADHAGDRPVASRWAVHCLQEPGQLWVTNLRHERVEIDDFDRYILLQLGEDINRGDMIQLVWNGPIKEGKLVLETEDENLSEAQMQALLAKEIDERLAWLAKAALILDIPG